MSSPASLTIRYFAWVRERIGTGEEVVEPPGAVRTVAELAAWLQQRDPRYAKALNDLATVRVAVDQELVDGGASIEGASEVAFFPPMTGG